MTAKRTFGWLAITLGATCLAILLFRGKNSLPTYNGKSVEQWVSSVRDFSTAGTDKDLRSMMSQLGTNALPPLLEILTNDDRFTGAIYLQMLRSHGPQLLKSYAADRLTKDARPRFTAAAIIPLLPDGGAGAIPALEAHLSQRNIPNNSWFCLAALANIGPAAVPALRRLETNSIFPVKTTVMGCWGANIQRGVRVRREMSAVAIAAYDPTSFQPIPIRANMGDSGDAATRNEALAALANLVPFHEAARDAVKKIAAESPDEIHRERAKHIIEQFYSELRIQIPP